MNGLRLEVLDKLLTRIAYIVLMHARQPLEIPLAVNQCWSMDFASDQFSNGRRFRVLNMMDAFSREIVGQLCEAHGKPKKIICDDTEFTRKAMFFRNRESGVRPGFIEPGKSTQNTFVESLNGKFRNECLNCHRF